MYNIEETSKIVISNGVSKLGRDDDFDVGNDYESRGRESIRKR